MWMAEQNLKCPDCQTFEWEWEENPDAWTAGLFWCLGCKSVEELRDRSQRDSHEGYKIRLFAEPEEE